MTQIPNIPTFENQVKTASFHFSVLTFLLIQVLFFLDEGLFSFDWMYNVGAWFVFALYFMIVFSSQLLIYFILNKFGWDGFAKTISFLMGGIIGLVILFNVIF